MFFDCKVFKNLEQPVTILYTTQSLCKNYIYSILSILMKVFFAGVKWRFSGSLQVKMTVDGIHSTERSMVGTFTMLDSKVLYVGGHPRAMRMGQGIIVTNYFKGCMKKVFVEGVL